MDNCNHEKQPCINDDSHPKYCFICNSDCLACKLDSFDFEDVGLEGIEGEMMMDYGGGGEEFSLGPSYVELITADAYAAESAEMERRIKNHTDFKTCEDMRINPNSMKPDGVKRKKKFTSIISQYDIVHELQGKVYQKFLHPLYDPSTKDVKEAITTIYKRLFKSSPAAATSSSAAASASSAAASSSSKKRGFNEMSDSVAQAVSPQSDSDCDTDGETKNYKITINISSEALKPAARAALTAWWDAMKSSVGGGDEFDLDIGARAPRGYDGYALAEIKFNDGAKLKEFSSDERTLDAVKRDLVELLPGRIKPEHICVVQGSILVAVPLALLPRLLEVLEGFELPGGKGLKATGEVAYRYVEVSVRYDKGELRSQLSRIAVAKKAPKSDGLDVTTLLANATIVDAYGEVVVEEELDAGEEVVEVATGAMQAMAVDDEARQQKVLEDAPHEFSCPITTFIMEDPVMATDGYTYERAHIEKWFEEHSKSPQTNKELVSRTVIPNHGLKAMIGDWALKNNVTPPDVPPVPPRTAASSESMGVSKVMENTKISSAGPPAASADSSESMGMPKATENTKKSSSAGPPATSADLGYPRYAKGDRPSFNDKNGTVHTVTITDVRQDGPENSLYTILLPTGKEKKTAESKLVGEGTGKDERKGSRPARVMMAVALELLAPNPNFLLAVWKGDYEAVKSLVEGGKVDVNMRETHTGNTALWMAAGRGHLEVVDLLVEKDGDVNIASKDGSTPLTMACERNYTEIVTLLLDKGADATKKMRRDGSTALDIARKIGNEGVYKQLIAPDDPSIDFELFLLAVEKGDDGGVKILIEIGGVDVNKLETHTGNTALWIAARRGHLEVVEHLIEKGGDVNIASKDGSTPLIVACKGNYKEVVALLLDKGADVTKKMRRDGSTALDAARKNEDVYKLLVAPDDPKFLLAVDKGDFEAVKSIIEGGGVDVNLREKHTGNTALWIAAMRGHGFVVELLIDKGGADFNIANKDGSTPMNVAWKLMKMDLADLDSEDSDDSDDGVYMAIVGLLADRGAQKVISKVGAQVSSLWKGLRRKGAKLIGKGKGAKKGSK